MSPPLRIGLVIVGSLLFVNGLSRIIWQFLQWACMVSWKERPALYHDGPRVYFGIEVCTAALGLALLIVAVIW